MTDLTRRELCIATAMLSMTAGNSSWAQPAHLAADDLLALLNPELRPILRDHLPAMLAAGPVTAPNSRESLQATMSLFLKAPAATPTFAERIVPAGARAPDARVWIVNSQPNAPPRPAILHMHGGGFVGGSPLISIRDLQELTEAIDCVAVSVEYRLAPRTRFPGALEDNYAALKWLYDNASLLGVDSSRIALMGESAGGGHAAMLAIKVRDRGEFPLVFQSLTYPMLDDRTGAVRPVAPHQGAIIWTPADNRFGWASLLGMPAGSDNIPPGAVPAREENLKGLPPAWIGVGSIDLFAEENVEYARRLVNAGVPTELVVAPGAPHGFDLLPPVSLVRRFKETRANALRRAFAVN